jgi:hypothetical protein
MKEVELPSSRNLAKATAVALLVALGLLVTVILPAEYGFDPLGTGSALGLTQLSASVPVPEDASTLKPNSAPTPTVEGPVAHYPAEYKFDSVEFEIGPYEYVEYKYRLENGASMLYSWTADSEVIHDLHGERDGAASNAAESFDKRNRRQASGMFTAPFSGIHGWYWENPGGDPVKIKLTTAGFYSAALEIRLDHTRHPHQVTPLARVVVRSEANTAP